MLRKSLAVVALLLSVSCATHRQTYFTGGDITLPKDLQSRLDRHAEIISLGINTEWLRKGRVDETHFVRAVEVAAKAVEDGKIPGAVLYADHFTAAPMPIAVGFKITDPEKRLAEYDTRYYVGDLTGPLVTVPLVFRAFAEGKLKETTTFGEVFPEWPESSKRAVTVKSLLNPGPRIRPCLGPLKPSTRDETLFWLSSERADDMNLGENFVLARMLEKVYGKPFSQLAEEKIFAMADLPSTSLSVRPEDRQFVAPGAYNPSTGVLAWGEGETGFERAWGPDAGDTGLITSVGDAATLALQLAPVIQAHHSEFPGMNPRGAMMGPNHLPGHDGFYWLGEEGSAFSVFKGGAAIVLCNANHPDGSSEGRQVVRQVLEELQQSLTE